MIRAIPLLDSSTKAKRFTCTPNCEPFAHLLTHISHALPWQNAIVLFPFPVLNIAAPPRCACPLIVNLFLNLSPPSEHLTRIILLVQTRYYVDNLYRFLTRSTSPIYIFY